MCGSVECMQINMRIWKQNSMQLNKKKNVNNLHKFIARQKIVLKAKSRKRERYPVIAKFYFVIKTPNWIIVFKHKVKTTTSKHFMQNLFGVGKRKEFKPNPFLYFFIKKNQIGENNSRNKKLQLQASYSYTRLHSSYIFFYSSNKWVNLERRWW